MNCEIEFLPVGEASKGGDAIIVRYGFADSYELMVIDGGHAESGAQIVDHIRKYFGEKAVLSHVVLAHSDVDHASGLRTVLSELTVNDLWMHVPWLSARGALPYFSSKRWTPEGLERAIKKEYDIINDIVETASGKKPFIPIYFPVTGAQIGPFRVLSPSRYVYERLLPQFDRTPDPDKASIEADYCWIGKAPPFETLTAQVKDILEKITRKWAKETWTHERLRDGGVASASNESSVVLYGDFGPGRRVLLTGDAGPFALFMAANYARNAGLPLQDFMFVQIPHHGSRRNVGPTILNEILGPVQPEGSAPQLSAFVSAPKDDETHPRKIVLNAFMRRGCGVVATQGTSKIFWDGFPPRPNYDTANPMRFSSEVEDYD